MNDHITEHERVARVFERMGERLDRVGWCQLVRKNRHGHNCLTAAMSGVMTFGERVTFYPRGVWEEPGTIVDPVRTLADQIGEEHPDLIERIRREYDGDVPCGPVVVRYNDTIARTVDDVQHMLKRAAERVRTQGER